MHTLHATPDTIKLPDNQNLRAHFVKHGFEDLISKIPIIDKLANTEKSPTEIMKMVDLALYFYQFKTHGEISTQATQEKKQNLLAVLFQMPLTPTSNNE